MKIIRLLQPLLLVLLTAALVFAGIQLYRLANFAAFGKKTEISRDLVLEKVKETLQLVTVEGNFSEIYSYKEYQHWDWAPFSKKAILLVRAKVLVGYDLEQMVLESDEERRVLTIRNIPEPRLLAIEHDVEFYDKREGTFNSFSNKDDNRLLRSAKQFVEDRAMQSGIEERAREQFERWLEMITFWAGQAGWEVEVEPLQTPALPT